MKYRKFDSLEWKASILGLGIAGLPLSENASTLTETTASIELIRFAIDQGVNYLDLGYPFDLQRQKHIVSAVGKALQGGYRERVKIAVTLPSHLIHSTADFDLHLDRQLDWLQDDRSDFCLFGRLNRESWPALQEFAALRWADASIEEGKIGNIGFSFHDHFQILRSVLAAYDRWAVCQFQFSYMDIDHDPGISGIRHAAEKGLAVVVTESLRHGRLAKKPPDPVSGIWGMGGDPGRFAAWALRFVWNYPEVSTVVCDVGSVRELAEIAVIADKAEPDNLTVPEEVLISRVRDAYKKLGRIPCSSCRPCMPCPEGIDVPRIFEIYNDAFIYEDVETARSIYRLEFHDAGRCNECRECEKRCARRLEIVNWLQQARRLLSDSSS